MKPAVRVEIDRLQAKSIDGRLMPRTLIDAARDKKNPLHGEFEWDKDKALEQNLLRQAQELLSEYTVIVMHGEATVKARHYVSLTSDRVSGGGYRVITQVMTDAVMRAQLLADALSELSSFQAKYRRLTELALVFDAIEAVENKVAPTVKRKQQRPPPEVRAA